MRSSLPQQSTTNSASEQPSTNKKRRAKAKNKQHEAPSPDKPAIEPEASEIPGPERDRKRLKTVRRRLQEIDALQKKIDSGAIASPERTQLEKISMKDDFERELGALLARLGDDA